MNPDSIPLSERVAASFSELSSAAKDLNKISDELSQSIASIDHVLQGLNLGVPTWVQIHGGENPHTGAQYWSRDLGYAKINSRWGIALRTREGDYNFPDEEVCESWPFSEAPRWLRVDGIEKVPELLEELVQSTRETTEKIRSRIDRAKELAAALKQAAAPKPVAGQKSLAGKLSDMADPSKPGNIPARDAKEGRK
jgi:ABC-type transporter Mla subunit MlaD